MALVEDDPTYGKHAVKPDTSENLRIRPAIQFWGVGAHRCGVGDTKVPRQKPNCANKPHMIWNNGKYSLVNVS